MIELTGINDQKCLVEPEHIDYIEEIGGGATAPWNEHILSLYVGTS